MAKTFILRGHDAITVDRSYPSTIQKDIRDVTAEEIVDQLGGYPDILWASPPCTQFSIASVSTHWKNRQPPIEGTELLAHTIRLIMQLNPSYWFIENPGGMMRKLQIMQQFPRRTFTFCQYGDNSMKPTDVWTNHRMFYPKMCSNGSSCHDRAPRGSKTGTQGKKDAHDRASLPREFCTYIADLPYNEREANAKK